MQTDRDGVGTDKHGGVPDPPACRSGVWTRLPQVLPLPFWMRPHSGGLDLRMAGFICHDHAYNKDSMVVAVDEVMA